MSFMGFPTGRDLSEMFGFVKEEDRDNWEKERNSRQNQARGTAADMASRSAGPALDMAKRGVQAQMHGAQMEAQRGSQAKVRMTKTETITEQSKNIDDPVTPDYGPDF